MTTLDFPRDFLWGAATSAHQVEGDNVNSDWWDWELAPGTHCKAPSGKACEHYTRYPRDIELLAALGLNTYRFSVEWARIEPSEGVFDPEALDHYRRVVECVLENGLVPMVTLNHFTLPRWVAAEGGWTWNRTPALFERYSRRVVDALGDGVPWYCTINEPTAMSTGGYMSDWGFPPRVVDPRRWRTSIAALIDAHRRAVIAIHELRPGAKAGLAAFTVETVANAGGKPAADYALRMNQDIFLEATADDDFIGVQTYTRNHLFLPRIAAPLTRLALAVRPIEDRIAARLLDLKTAAPGTQALPGQRVTQMGWEYRPEALAAVVRRIAKLCPGKDLVVTENGVATLKDTERVEFITRALAALHEAMAEGAPVRGYIHWSLMDNFEWAHGYGPKFGLIAVDFETQERTVRPSGFYLGGIARSGQLYVEDAGPAEAATATSRPATA
ncbi:MAG: family 1 glycosylhydrolase [Candidatus Limnocylindrales bacterium]